MKALGGAVHARVVTPLALKELRGGPRLTAGSAKTVVVKFRVGGKMVWTAIEEMEWKHEVADLVARLRKVRGDSFWLIPGRWPAAGAW